MNFRKGALLIQNPKEKCEREMLTKEAVYAFQRAREKFDHLTIIGVGIGGAYSLMLAQRFMPERVAIAPFAGMHEEEDFFTEVKSLVRGLYAVCSDITVYLPKGLPEWLERKMRRLMNEVKGREKLIVRYDSENELYELLQDVADEMQQMKTLA